MSMKENQEDRYARQAVFGPVGPAGQQRLSASKVLLIGCGALGSHLAETLVRAGVGELTLIDRDFVELTNLQRQSLFDEADVEANLPKAEAAARHLRRINSQVTVTPVVADINHESIEYYLGKPDLILDGTDNLQVRFLINDVAVKHNIGWVYGACLGAVGMALVVLPGGRPCLRCVIDGPPEPGQLPTCETAGILEPAVAMVAAFQAAEAFKLLTGQQEAVNRSFVHFDLWGNRLTQTPVGQVGSDCKCCGHRQFEFLAGRGSLSTISLCGRNSVQVRPKGVGGKLDLGELAGRLEAAGAVSRNEFLVRLELAEHQMTIFPDGRAIIKGTDNIDEARSLYAKYVGH